MGRLVMRSWRMTSDHVSLLGPSRVYAAHDRASRGSTSWCRGVRLPEHHTTLRERVDVRCLHRTRLVNIVTLDILAPEIIGQDQDDVWFRRPLVSRDRGDNCERKDCEAEELDSLIHSISLSTVFDRMATQSRPGKSLYFGILPLPNSASKRHAWRPR